MYDSANQNPFDRVSGTLDRDPVQPDYQSSKEADYDNVENDSANDIENGNEDDNDNDIENDTKNDMQHDRKEKGPQYAQWSTETHKNENAYMKPCDKIIGEIEKVQNMKYYKK